MSRSNPRVLSTLERAGGFASAQEVYRLMQREGQSIGLTTVYRSLQSLVNENVVDVLRREDGEAIYRLCGESHSSFSLQELRHHDRNRRRGD